MAPSPLDWSLIRRPCVRPRCGSDAIDGRDVCAEHAVETDAIRPRDLQRRFRRAVLRRSPWCEDASHDGVLVPARDAHHVRAPAQFAPWDRARAWSPANGMALCRACHVRITAAFARVE